MAAAGGQGVYDDFRPITQLKGYSAVYKAKTFEAPRTYESKGNRGYRDTRRDATPDWDVAGVGNGMFTSFTATRVFHDTTESKMSKMLEQDNLNIKGGYIQFKDTTPWEDILPIVNGMKSYMSWWSPLFPEEDVEQARGEMRNEGFDDEFYTTSPFNDDANRVPGANLRITTDISDILQAYKNDIAGPDINVEARKLGTFRYIREVMHGVLVCPAEINEFSEYPLVSDSMFDVDEAVLTWRPYCSIEESGRMWDHVALAFYIPKERSFQLPNGKFEYLLKSYN